MTAPELPKKAEPKFIISENTVTEIARLLAMPDHAMEDEDYDAEKKVICELRANPYIPTANKAKLAEHMIKHMEQMREEYPDKYHEILAHGMINHIKALSETAADKRIADVIESLEFLKTCNNTDIGIDLMIDLLRTNEESKIALLRGDEG